MILIARLELLKYGLITEAQQLHQIVESHGGDENDESASEAEEEAETTDAGTGKKSEKKDSKAVLEKLRKDIDEALDKIKSDNQIESGSIPTSTRNVETLRQMYINSFLKKLAVKKVCTACKGGWKKIVLYQSRIVFSLYCGTTSVAIGYVECFGCLDIFIGCY